MYLKSLNNLINQKQQSVLQQLDRAIDIKQGQESEALTSLLQKLHGKDFWIWDRELHKQEYVRTNKECCFTHIIPGKLVKNGTQRPIYPWQKQIFDTIFDESDNVPYYQRRHLAWLKARGIGGSSLITRIMAWLCCRDDRYRGQEMYIVTGNRIELSTYLVSMLRNLFGGLLPESKETVAIINGCTITGFPALRASAIRGTNPVFCMADEASMWLPNYQQEVFDILQGLISKNNPYLVFLSSPNQESDLMSQIFKQEESSCIYRRIRTDWTVGEDTGQGNIFSQSDLAKCRMSSSWDRELCLRFINKRGNTFLPSWISRAQEFSYDPDLIPSESPKTMAIDPSWGSSNTGIVVTDSRDGRVAVLYAEEFTHETSENMVELVRELYHKYAPISRIFIDGSQISFIKSCKLALMNELREEVNYQEAIERYKANHSDWKINMVLQPVNFGANHGVAMLAHARTILQDGYIMIHPKFDALHQSLFTCVDTEGKMEKQATSHNDILDALRMCLQNYEFS